MAMVINNNMPAKRTLNILNRNSAAQQKNSTRVASGLKIASAQDDAAGYAISERMRVRIRALDQANQNTQNDSSLMKTAEGAVGNTIDILKSLKEKCINAANDSNTDEDRKTIQKEVDQFIDQIDDNAQVTYNGKALVDGTKNNAAVATKTILLNQSLKEGTLAGDKLTSLANRAGDSLGIQSTDYYQVSWVENGKIHTTSGQVGNNSIKDILSTPDAEGNTLQATVAATKSDGLIGTTEPAKEFAETGMKAYNSNNLNIDQVLDMFSEIDGLENKLQGMTHGGTETITGYYTAAPGEDAPASGIDNKQTITITYKTDGVGVHYEVSGVKAGPASGGTEINDSSNAVSLFTKTVPSSTYVDFSGAGVTGVSGYLDAPKLISGTSNLPNVSNSLPSAGTIATSALSSIGTILTDMSTLIGTNAGVYDLANEGYYYATGYDDNNNPTGFAIASGTITKTSNSTFGNATFTISSDATVGKTLYKLTLSDANVTDANIVFAGNAAGTDRDLPKTISTYPDEGTVDKYNKDVYTPDGTYGVAVVANDAGVDNQISGLTISILDQDLNVKKNANAALDQFKLYQRAENKTGDQALNFHIGSEANQAIKVGFTDMRAQALGLKGVDGTRINVNTKENANASINVLENAITKALDQQTTIGAVQARLEYTSANLTTASENVQASESTIRDADMAKEMTEYTKNNILMQAAQAMLAQANQSSSSVLSLLQ